MDKCGKEEDVGGYQIEEGIYMHHMKIHSLQSAIKARREWVGRVKGQHTTKGLAIPGGGYREIWQETEAPKRKTTQEMC